MKLTVIFSYPRSLDLGNCILVRIVFKEPALLPDGLYLTRWRKRAFIINQTLKEMIEPCASRVYCVWCAGSPWTSLGTYEETVLTRFSCFINNAFDDRSEHERHSPTCPFVKGEYTQNVPLPVTNATAPAIPLVRHVASATPSSSQDRTVIGLSSVPELAITAFSSGAVTIWNVERQLIVSDGYFYVQFGSAYSLCGTPQRPNLGAYLMTGKVRRFVNIAYHQPVSCELAIRL